MFGPSLGGMLVVDLNATCQWDNTKRSVVLLLYWKPGKLMILLRNKLKMAGSYGGMSHEEGAWAPINSHNTMGLEMKEYYHGESQCLCC